MIFRPPFRGPFGGCVCFEDPASFARVYDQFFSTFFERKGIKREKNVYSASDISRVFGRDREGFVQFLESLVIKIGTDPNLVLNLVWTTLSVEKLSEGIRYYGVGRYAVKTVSPNKFLADLSQYYPYICAWIVSNRGKIYNTVVLLDDLRGEITTAWNELFENHAVWILPNGDLCDRTISAADLCIRYFDEKLYSIRGRLCEEDLLKICDSLNIKAHVHYVGHPELKFMVPVEQTSIPLHLCYKRPMIFVLKEQLMPSEVEYIRKKRELLVAIERYSSEIGSGYKFIDYSKDYRYLKDGDHLIYLGPRGKEQVEYLKGLGWSVTALSAHDILKRYQT